MLNVASKTIHQLLAEAKEAEALLKYDEAIEAYQQVIVLDPLNEIAYNRLIIIYRKQKLYKKEAEVINKGIKAFEKHYNAKKSKSKKLSEISEKLSKSLGLTDKKGNTLYEPEPIAKWKKRLFIVEKRMTKKPKK